MAERFEFSSEEIELRFVDHWALADQYRHRLESEFNVKTDLQTRRLYLAIVSAYKDIERYKNFHLVDPFAQKSDAIKRVAYLSKWICRFKPLSVIEDSSAEGYDATNANVDKITLINELFALQVAAIHLSVHVGRDFVIGPEKAYEIAYEMLFRQVNEDSFMLVFQMIIDHLKNENIVILV